MAIQDLAIQEKDWLRKWKPHRKHPKTGKKTSGLAMAQDWWSSTGTIWCIHRLDPHGGRLTDVVKRYQVAQCDISPCTNNPPPLTSPFTEICKNDRWLSGDTTIRSMTISQLLHGWSVATRTAKSNNTCADVVSSINCPWPNSVPVLTWCPRQLASWKKWDGADGTKRNAQLVRLQANLCCMHMWNRHAAWPSQGSDAWFARHVPLYSGKLS